MHNWLLFAVLAASVPLPSHASPVQGTVAPAEKGGAAAYADEAAVVERDEVVYKYNADGTGTKTETAAIRVQSGAALQSFAVLSFPYASATEGLDIVYARVRKPDGSLVETPASDAQDQPAPATQVAPMYSDLRYKQLPVRSLAVGDTVEFQIRQTQKQPEIVGEFWGAENFGAGLVYLDRRIELHVPKSKKVTVYSPKYPPEAADTGDERVYRWKGAQLHRTTAKDEDAPTQDKTAPIAWTTFASWEAVGAWYQALLAGRDDVTPALQAKADEVTAGAKTDTDRVRALYEYVSQHNHYIAVAFGVGRYQPHTASEVFANQYGDCKDKHTLLAALLRAKGFHPSAALIGAGIEMNEKVPSPAAFNHLITFVNVDGGPVWLDATTEVAPYRVLLPTVRDKQALVVPAKSDPLLPRLTKTPAELPFAAVDHFEGTFELSKQGTTKGSVAVSMRGDNEVLMRYATRQVARAQWDQLGQAYVDNNGFFGKANGVIMGMGDDLSRPWEMRYAYTQDAWSQWKSYQIGSLLPNVTVPVIDEKHPPKQEIDFGTTHTQSARSTVKLPAGYGAELPEAIHLATTFAKFDETYRVVDGSLVSEFTLEVLKPKVDATEWKEVKKLEDAVGTQPWIQLTSLKKTAGEEGPPLAGENNTVAAELVQQAHNAIEAKDFTLAKQKSDQAIAVNEKQAYAWSQRGWLAWQNHELQEAANDYERELEQHPDELDQYPDLIRLEGFVGRSDQRLKHLLAYGKLAGDNAAAVLFSGSQLAGADHVSDAIEIYRAGAKAIPDNKLIQVELGTTLLRAGQKEEGTSVLQRALDGSSDPDALNDGAYALATSGISTSMPLAETSARKAVELLESESTQTTLDSVNERAFRRANLLVASWDTLGWVYFNEGKATLAEDYVRAAWRNASNAEEGLHMGEILEKKGENKAALETYEMAAGQSGGANSKTPVATALRAHIEELKKKGVAAQEERPDRLLQDQRTFHLPRPSGTKGSGVFALQVSAAGTEKVAMLRGDQSLRPFDEALKKLDLRLGVPKDSHASLLRSGILFCSSEPTCDFVLVPPEVASTK